MHSGLAWGRRIFKNFVFLVDMGSFNIQTNNKREIFNFSKKNCPNKFDFKNMNIFLNAHFSVLVIFWF
jgi:hypothetical protein